MADYPHKIQRIIDEGYEFNFGDYISKGFNLVQKNLGGYIAFFLLISIGSLIVGLIPFIGALALWVLTPALSIGPFHVAHRLDKGEEPSFNDFFKGTDKLGDLFVTMLLTALIIAACVIPAMLVFGFSTFTMMDTYGGAYGDVDYSGMGTAVITMFICMIPAMYFGISFMWAPQLVWFYNMRPWDAMVASRKLIGRNFWIFLAFIFVAGIIASLGILLLFIGLLFTYPAMICMQYAAFADVTELLSEEDDNAEDRILDHFAPTE